MKTLLTLAFAFCAVCTSSAQTIIHTDIPIDGACGLKLGDTINPKDKGLNPKKSIYGRHLYSIDKVPAPLKDVSGQVIGNYTAQILVSTNQIYWIEIDKIPIRYLKEIKNTLEANYGKFELGLYPESKPGEPRLLSHSGCHIISRSNPNKKIIFQIVSGGSGRESTVSLSYENKTIEADGLRLAKSELSLEGIGGKAISAENKIRENKKTAESPVSVDGFAGLRLNTIATKSMLKSFGAEDHGESRIPVKKVPDPIRDDKGNPVGEYTIYVTPQTRKIYKIEVENIPVACEGRFLKALKKYGVVEFGDSLTISNSKMPDVSIFTFKYNGMISARCRNTATEQEIELK